MRTLFLFICLVVGFGLSAQTSEFTKQVTFNGQRIRIDADLAESIKVTSTDTDFVKFKVSYSVNEGESDDALDVSIKEQSDYLKLDVSLDERKVNEASSGDCDCEGYTNCWTRDGGKRFCLDLRMKVEIQIPQGTSFKVETAIGDIILDNVYGDFDLNTATGTIEVEWPESAGVKVDFDTANGDIYTDTGLIKNNEKGLPLISGHELVAQVGDGQYRVRLESAVGAIYFRTRK